MLKTTDVCIEYYDQRIHAYGNYGFGKIIQHKRTRQGKAFHSFNFYIMYRIMMYVNARKKLKGKKYMPAKYREMISGNMTEKAKQVIFCVPEGGSKLIWDKDDGLKQMIEKLYVEEYNYFVDIIYGSNIRKRPIRKSLTKNTSFILIDKSDGLDFFGFGDPKDQDAKTQRVYTKFVKYIMSRLMKYFKDFNLVMKIYDVLATRLRYIAYGTPDSWDTNKNLRKAVIKAYNIVIKANPSSSQKMISEAFFNLNALDSIQSSISELESVNKYVTLKLKMLQQKEKKAGKRQRPSID